MIIRPHRTPIAKAAQDACSDTSLDLLCVDMAKDCTEVTFTGPNSFPGYTPPVAQLELNEHHH